MQKKDRLKLVLGGLAPVRQGQRCGRRSDDPGSLSHGSLCCGLLVRGGQGPARALTASTQQLSSAALSWLHPPPPPTPVISSSLPEESIWGAIPTLSARSGRGALGVGSLHVSRGDLGVRERAKYHQPGLVAVSSLAGGWGQGAIKWDRAPSARPCEDPRSLTVTWHAHPCLTRRSRSYKGIELLLKVTQLLSVKATTGSCPPAFTSGQRVSA